jgi:site-specific DNA-cytosine methylase
MTVNGKCLTANIMEYPKIGRECSLLDILEDNVDQKYFLSEKLLGGGKSKDDKEPTIGLAVSSGYPKMRGQGTLLQVGLVNEKDNMAQRIYDTDGISVSIRSQGGGQGAKTGLYKINTIGIIDTDYSNDKGFHGSNYRPRHRIIDSNGIGRAISTVESQMPYISNTLDSDGYLRSGERPRDDKGNTKLLPIGHSRIRRLTPIECDRLQGFTDDWTKYGIDDKCSTIEISDTQRYKCLGNAVTTTVISDISSKWVN